MPIFASKLTPSLLHVTPNDVGIPNLFFFPKSILGIFKLYDCDMLSSSVFVIFLIQLPIYLSLLLIMSTVVL